MDASNNPYEPPATQSSARQAPPSPATTSLIRQIVGSFVCSCLGGLVGLLIPGDGNLGHISVICLFVFFGWLFWIRRGQSVWATLGICFGLLVLWWPVALAFRESGRGLY